MASLKAKEFLEKLLQHPKLSHEYMKDQTKNEIMDLFDEVAEVSVVVDCQHVYEEEV